MMRESLLLLVLIIVCVEADPCLPSTVYNAGYLDTTGTISNPDPYDGIATYGTDPNSCNWRVSAPGQTVRVQSSALNLTCGDYLRVYDGMVATPAINVTCSAAPFNFSTTGGVLYVEFIGSGGTPATGFSLDWESVQPLDCSASVGYLTLCPGQTSFSYPHDFPNTPYPLMGSVLCMWSMSIATGYSVFMRVTHDLDYCTRLTFSFYSDGDEYYYTVVPTRDATHDAGDTTFINTNRATSLLLYFEERGDEPQSSVYGLCDSGDHRGFRLYFEVFPTVNITTTMCPLVTVLGPTPTTGVFTSHAPYNNQTLTPRVDGRCTWNITALPGMYPAVRFVGQYQFNLSPTGRQFLTVYDGPTEDWAHLWSNGQHISSLQSCGQTEDWIIGRSSTILVVYDTMRSESMGFQMEYRTDMLAPVETPPVCESFGIYPSSSDPSSDSYTSHSLYPKYEGFNAHVQAPIFHGINGTIDRHLLCEWEWETTNPTYTEFTVVLEFLDLAPGGVLAIYANAHDSYVPTIILTNALTATSNKGVESFPLIAPMVAKSLHLKFFYSTGSIASQGIRATITKTSWNCPAQCNGQVSLLSGTYGVIRAPCNQTLAAPFVCKYKITVSEGLYVRLSIMNWQLESWDVAVWDGADKTARQLYVTHMETVTPQTGDYYESSNLGSLLYFDKSRSTMPYYYALSTGNTMYLEVTVYDFVEPTIDPDVYYWQFHTAQLEYHAVKPAQCGSPYKDKNIRLEPGMFGYIQAPEPFTGTVRTAPRQDCGWSLQHYTGTVAEIVVTLEAYSLAPNEFLQLLIIDPDTIETKIITLTAQHVGKNLTSSLINGKLQIQFSTHRVSSGHGFRLRYEYLNPQLNCDPTACTPGGATITVPDNGQTVYLGRPCPFLGAQGAASAAETCKWRLRPQTPGNIVYARLNYLSLSTGDFKLFFVDPIDPSTRTPLLIASSVDMLPFTGSTGLVDVSYTMNSTTLPPSAHGWVLRAAVGPPLVSCRPGFSLDGDPSPYDYTPLVPYTGVARVTGSCKTQFDVGVYNASFTLQNYSLITGETLELIEMYTPWGDTYSRLLTAADVGKTFYRMSPRQPTVAYNYMYLVMTSTGVTHGAGYRVTVAGGDTPIERQCNDTVFSNTVITPSSSTSTYEFVHQNVTASTGIGTVWGYPCPYVSTDPRTFYDQSVLEFQFSPADSTSSAGVIFDRLETVSSDLIEFYDGIGPPAPGVLPFAASRHDLGPDLGAPDGFPMRLGDRAHVVAPSGFMFMRAFMSRSSLYFPMMGRVINVPGRQSQQCLRAPITIPIDPHTEPKAFIIQAPYPYDGTTSIASHSLCQWQARVPAYYQVRFTLLTMNMPSYNRPVISIESGTLPTVMTLAVWNSSIVDGTTFVLSPTRSFRTIRLVFNSRTTYPADKGFRIQLTYVRDYLGVPSSQCPAHADESTVVIHPQPADHGLISYPCPFYFNGTYGTNINATWKIVPPAGYGVVINFYYISLPGCTGDSRINFMEGTDFSTGVLRSVYCGGSVGLPAIATPDTPLLLQFSNDNVPNINGGYGFVGEYSLFASDTFAPGLGYGYCNNINGGSYTSSGYSTQDHDNTVDWIYPVPHGLARYLPEESCSYYWYTYPVTMHIHSLDVGLGDAMFVYANGIPMPVRVFGPGTYLNVPSLHVPSGNLRLAFVSDDDLNVGWGWNITFELNPAVSPFNNSQMCEEETTVNVTALGQVVRFPPWGREGYTGLSSSCTWKLVAPAGAQIDVTLLYADLSRGLHSSSGDDQLGLYDGEVGNMAYYSYQTAYDATFTSARTGLLPRDFEHVVTASNIASIYFRSLDSEDFAYGFAFVVSVANAVPPNCSNTCLPTQTTAQAITTPAVVTGTHGYITAPCPYGFFDYYVGVTCAYLITVPVGNVVQLTLADLNGGTSINIYNGGTTAPRPSSQALPRRGRASTPQLAPLCWCIFYR